MLTSDRLQATPCRFNEPASARRDCVPHVISVPRPPIPRGATDEQLPGCRFRRMPAV